MTKMLQWTMVLAISLLSSQVTQGRDNSLVGNEAAQNQAQTAQQKPSPVKVTVKDAAGEPLIGAVVSVKGTTRAKATGVDGTATVSAASGETLSVTYLGYKPQEIACTGQQDVSVEMQEDAIGIGEVVVVGFGSQKKVNLTGSVSVVKAEALTSRPVANVSQALQGMVPGLNVSPTAKGGALNQGMSINIRGGGTIGAGSNSSPLVLIDGMEGDLNSINTQDIESISILKDAAASSIYGSRAPFGVILITTKKGTTGQTTVSYNNNFRWSSPMGIPTMMDSETFAEYINLASINNGGNAHVSAENMDRIRDHKSGVLKDEVTGQTGTNKNKWNYAGGGHANRDWFKEMYKKNQFSHEHNISISGGTEKVQYYISANYMDQGGILRYSGDDLQRMGFSAKINAQLAKWAQFSSNTKFVREDYTSSTFQVANAGGNPDNNGQQLFHDIARQWPTMALKTPEGYLAENGMVLPSQYIDGNFVGNMVDGGRYTQVIDRLYQQFQLTLTPIKGWNIQAEANLRITNRDRKTELKTNYIYGPDGSRNAYGFTTNGARQEQWREDYLSPNIYTEYSHQFESGHYFKVMVGFQSEVNLPRNFVASGDNLVSNDMPSLNLAPENKTASAVYDQWATMGVFARANYNYKERYLFEANIRYDGSSRFASEKRWNWFPSFSAGWNIANESFMEGAKGVVNLLKLRASYGQLGNQNTDAFYPYYSTMPIGYSRGNQWIINGKIPATYTNAPGLVSPLLTWETIESYDVAVDFGFFNNRLTGSVGFYNRLTKNMIGPAPTMPAVLGVSVPKTNNADLRNRGWEVELGWRDNTTYGFSYGVRVNFSDNVRKVLRYPNETLDVNQWYNNKMDGVQWGYTSIGIAQTDEEMAAHLKKVDQSSLGSNWGAGDMMYADLDNNGKIDRGQMTLGKTGDWQIIGNNSPRFAYGINVDLAYKGFDLSFFLQGVGKSEWTISPGTNYFFGINGISVWQMSAFTTHLDFWRAADDKGYFGPNPDAYFPRLLEENSKNTQQQTHFLQDASYIRMKNLQVGYTLPAAVTQSFYCKKLRVFVSMDNVFTITKLNKAFDPETINSEYGPGKAYPLSSVISAGLSITF